MLCSRVLRLIPARCLRRCAPAPICLPAISRVKNSSLTLLGLLSLGLGKRLGTVPKPHVPRLAAGPLGARGSWRRWDGEQRPGQEMLRGRGLLESSAGAGFEGAVWQPATAACSLQVTCPSSPAFAGFHLKKKKKKIFRQKSSAAFPGGVPGVCAASSPGCSMSGAGVGLSRQRFSN